MGNSYCYFYHNKWYPCKDKDDFYEKQASGYDVKFFKDGRKCDSLNKKTKKNNNKKPEKPECKDSNGTVITNDYFAPELFGDTGIKKFIEFLIKYYPNEVTDIAGSPDKLRKVKDADDCLIIKLFNTNDPVKNMIIGSYIYSRWKDYVGGFNNLVVRSKQEFDTWRNSGGRFFDDDNSPKTKEEWEEVLNWFYPGGKIVEIDGQIVLLYKFDIFDNIVNFDATKDDGSIDMERIKNDLTSNQYRYYYYTYPKNNNTENKEEYPKYTTEWEIYFDNGIKMKKLDNLGLQKTITIKENYFRKFLLEKIRDKKEHKTIFVVNENQTPQPTSGKPLRGQRGGSSNSLGSQGRNNSEGDLFGIFAQKTLNSPESIKTFINNGTIKLQKAIDIGAKSDYFKDWNDLATKYNAEKLKYNGAEIDDTNKSVLRAPTQASNYTKIPFYDRLQISGNPEKNIAVFWEPVGNMAKLDVVDKGVNPEECRKILIQYLKDALLGTALGTCEEKWNRKYQICSCNTKGGFDNFKYYGKLQTKDTRGRDKINISRQSSEFQTTDTTNQTTTTGIGTNNPNYGISFKNWPKGRNLPQIFNKTLNWKEITNMLRGGKYLVRGGSYTTIDGQWVINGFDSPNGGDCASKTFKAGPDVYCQTTTNESFDKKIDSKLLKTIRNKNKKESVIENMIRNIIKDKL